MNGAYAASQIPKLQSQVMALKSKVRGQGREIAKLTGLVEAQGEAIQELKDRPAQLIRHGGPIK